jgi:predicted component of type VI protein secretion system
MPKLTLKFDTRELKECDLGGHPVSIGRLPDNALVISDPAVSARHARVTWEADHYVIEDLRSTNGTYVNNKPIARHTLLDGDVILIGKHSVLFSQQGVAEADVTALNHGSPSQVFYGGFPKTAIPTAKGGIGTLKLKGGSTDKDEYVLAAVTTMIGRAETAQIRTKGWFKSPQAAAITRKGEGFAITPMGAPVVVNGQKIIGRRDLVSGDVIEVSGLTLEFTLA